MAATHFQRPGSTATDCACGRDKKNDRNCRGMTLTVTVKDPRFVTCDACRRHPDVQAFLATERAAAAVRAARIPTVNAVLAGYGSTATVTGTDGQFVTIRWADGKVATLTERQLANFTVVANNKPACT